MMENTDYGQIVGDTANAPYFNSLLAQGFLLRNIQANYHPSDENYLAVAGGDTFVKGGQYFPKLKLAVPNIADRLEAASKSWKAYEQGMGSPCNPSTKYDKDYEPDEAPFFLFADIFDDKPRCRALGSGRHQGIEHRSHRCRHHAGFRLDRGRRLFRRRDAWRRLAQEPQGAGPGG